MLKEHIAFFDYDDLNHTVFSLREWVESKHKFSQVHSLQIMRDPETGNSKGFAFINFASFDASDAAMEAMNGQYLCNRPITISYAFKKEAKGERHGSAAGTVYMDVKALKLALQCAVQCTCPCL